MSSRSESEARGVSIAHAWYVVAILTLANVSGLLDRQILSLLVGPMKRDLAITDAQVGFIQGPAFVVFYALLGFPLGRLVDRGSRRAIVSAGVALWSLFTVLSGASRNFMQMVGARIGVGVGEATLGPAAISMVSDAFPEEKRGFALSVFATAIFFGSGLGYFIGAQLVGSADISGMVTLPLIGDVHRWQAVFAYVGIPGFVIALLALAMKEPPRSEPESYNPPVSQVFAYFRKHLRTVLCISLGFASSSAVNWAMGAWIATFFNRTFNWTPTQAGTYMGTLTMTVGVIGALLGGRITDTWVARGMIDAPIRVGIISAVAMLVFAGAFPLMPTAWMSAALLVIVNLFAAMPWGAASLAIGEALPSRMRGQGSAIYQMIVGLVGGAVGPWAVGLMTDKVFHDPASVRYSLSICIIAGMAIAIVLLQLGRSAYVNTVETVRREHPERR